jgi:multimeric flavodoxin WrbA
MLKENWIKSRSQQIPKSNTIKYLEQACEGLEENKGEESDIIHVKIKPLD